MAGNFYREHGTPCKTLVIFAKLHGATTQKTAGLAVKTVFKELGEDVDWIGCTL